MVIKVKSYQTKKAPWTFLPENKLPYLTFRPFFFKRLFFYSAFHSIFVPFPLLFGLERSMRGSSEENIATPCRGGRVKSLQLNQDEKEYHFFQFSKRAVFVEFIHLLNFVFTLCPNWGLANNRLPKTSYTPQSSHVLVIWEKFKLVWRHTRWQTNGPQ